MTTRPITVLMPVYNGAAYLGDAVDSILEQTFTNFEFLIVDDASTDASPKILAEYAAKDERIKILRNDMNLGLPHSLNKGLACIKTPLTARMDADDIAFPERLAQQVACFTDQPALTVLGTPVVFMDEQENAAPTLIRYPAAHEDIVRALWAHEASIAHPTVMFRTQAITSLGGYRPVVQFAEDYDLWLRVAEQGILKNLQEPLLWYRRSTTSVSTTKSTEQALCVVLSWISAFCRKYGKKDPLAGMTDFPSWEDALRILESQEDEPLAILGEMALKKSDWTIILKSPVVVAAVLDRQIPLEQLELLLQRGGTLPACVSSEYLRWLVPLCARQRSLRYLAQQLAHELSLRIARLFHLR